MRNLKKYIVKGKNEREILEKTSSVLGVEKEQLEYEVLGIKKGIFGKIKEVELKIWCKNIIADSNFVEKDKENFEEDAVNKSKRELKTEDFFEVFIEKKGIYGKIEKGTEIKKEEFNKYLLEMFLYLEKREIKGVDKEKVRDILLKCSGEKVKIAEYIENYYIDGKFEIGVTEDKMTAFVKIDKAVRGNEVRIEEVLEMAERQGIKYGVNKAALKEKIDRGLINEKIVFANGDFPVDGDNGRIEYMFETDLSPKFYIDDMGRVDYKTIINSIKNIKMGDVVAVRIPYSEGIGGKNVFGEAVKAKAGEDKKFIKGENVIEGMNQDELIAMIDGRVSLKNEEINILPVYEVNGDVDLKSGNIDFLGVVIIKGNVRDGFKVKAEGDVIVEGLVEDATIISGANIFVKNGILGKEGGNGIIRAEGSVNTKFLQNIKVNAKKNIEVLDHILNSDVEADDCILAINGKGKIIGGRVVAGIKIAAREAGNIYGVKCELEIGVTEQLYNMKIKVDTEYNSKVDEVEKIELGVKKAVEKLYWKNPELDRVKYINELKKEIMKISEEKHNIDEKIKRSKRGSIFIRDTLFKGVIIKIDGVQINPKENFNYVRFYLGDEKEVAVGTFDEEEGK